MRVIICAGCGRRFSVINFRQDKAKFCGRHCYFDHRKKHHVVREGTKSLHMGYVIVYKPSHPRASTNGYIREHRLIMEAHLGRPLKPKEHVHHINHVKTDNRLDNLTLISPSSHTILHHKGKKESNEMREKLRRFHLGKKASIETRKKMSKSRLGVLRGIQKNSSTGAVGVWFNKKTNRYQSYFTRYRKRKYLGTYRKKEDAIRAYKNYLMII